LGRVNIYGLSRNTARPRDLAEHASFFSVYWPLALSSRAANGPRISSFHGLLYCSPLQQFRSNPRPPPSIRNLSPLPIPNSQLFHSFISPRPTLLLPSSRRTRCCHHLDSSPEPRRRLCRIRLAIYPHHHHPFRHSGSPFSPVMMATIVGGQSFSCPRGTSGGPLAPDGENPELLGIWLRTLAASPCVAFSKLASDDEMEHACFSGGPHMFGSAVCCAAGVRGAPHDGAGRVHKFSYGTDIFFVMVNPQAAGGECCLGHKNGGSHPRYPCFLELVECTGCCCRKFV
jgi:hypothetical protein